MKTRSFLKLSSMALAIATISTGAYSAQLEEIIVTAQKRAESLQDVPISMTAITGERMKDAGITSFADLNGFVPNLAISENAVALAQKIVENFEKKNFKIPKTFTPAELSYEECQKIIENDTKIKGNEKSGKKAKTKPKTKTKKK